MARKQYDISGGYMQTRFKRVCSIMGWHCDGEAWEGEGETRGSVPGFTWIQRAATQNAYWRVVQYTGRDYRERVLSSNYSGAELDAWFAGIMAAHEALVKLHSDIVLSVDSLRGNEAFAAQAIRNSL